MPQPLEISSDLDLTVLMFATAAAVATGLLFGLAPALSAFVSTPASTLREIGRCGASQIAPFRQRAGRRAGGAGRGDARRGGPILPASVGSADGWRRIRRGAGPASAARNLPRQAHAGTAGTAVPASESSWRRCGSHAPIRSCYLCSTHRLVRALDPMDEYVRDLAGRIGDELVGPQQARREHRF
jgi:hypothetical protein